MASGVLMGIASSQAVCDGLRDGCHTLGEYVGRLRTLGTVAVVQFSDVSSDAKDNFAIAVHRWCHRAQVALPCGSSFCRIVASADSNSR